MKKGIISIFMLLIATAVFPQTTTVTSPDKNTSVAFALKDGEASYNISNNGKVLIENSPLGVIANIGDFRSNLQFVDFATSTVSKSYTQDKIKRFSNKYDANQLICNVKNSKGNTMQFVIEVSNNNVAIKYNFPKNLEVGSIVIEKECTGFRFPQHTTTFIVPQSKAMIGWKRTKPSYEEEYTNDEPVGTPSKFGHGFTFPSLFHVGDDGWVLLSETGVDSRFCGSRLSDPDKNGIYYIAYPMPEENNGNGTSAPAFSLPGSTPWRTITVGSTLKPIVETTIPWDLVEPLYKSEHSYKYGRGTWSWILWQDDSINFEDQKRYIDLAKAMGYQYTLIDNWWDKNIGREKMKNLIEYAHSQGIDIFLWYSSSGYWNDIVQGPINCMDNPIIRKREMRWMKELGVKGIKVDFFGGDKQETMRLYESILSDADDNGLMVIFHGCTIPRGWERMYPNYVGSEAILASENMIFSQDFCNYEAFASTLHPFIRNSIGCMEYGGGFLNKRLHKSNNSGNIRRTTDCFQIATAILFQNPIQNFALAPNNLTDANPILLDFMKSVPTTWVDTKFVDGYPGKYTIIARNSGEKWYVAGINAQKTPIKVKLNLDMIGAKKKITIYNDDKKLNPTKSEITTDKNSSVVVTIQAEGGFVIVANE